jgi:hypothetical protein
MSSRDRTDDPRPPEKTTTDSERSGIQLRV